MMFKKFTINNQQTTSYRNSNCFDKNFTLKIQLIVALRSMIGPHPVVYPTNSNA